MNQNVNIIYFSPTGNTKKIVQSIATGISDRVRTYDLTSPQSRLELEVTQFGREEIVIVGVPVYGGRMPSIVNESLEKFRGDKTLLIPVVTYGNRAYEDALLELSHLMGKNGFISIAAGAFLGEHSYTSKVATDRPNKEDLDIAVQYGQRVAKKILELDPLKIVSIEIPGQVPYKANMVMPVFVPLTSDACTACGVCAKVCPSGAINRVNFTEIDSEKCIRCTACTRICPEDAKFFKHESYDFIVKRLVDHFSEIQKEAEWFI
ncbi:EFR1 family ferrodoxin [Fusibacter ferrireducens]|uniref:EFR1 family ferrodoxin n=1 Tax=Fusibacter ferrireducens TaxID=2785058 RepID=A0ABR9ZSC5_9FIRM|nr:EFR1 family ferrodoxin [Fusibacter ferrireducens]MBF4693350.1 EFR1 family ferrodoxin [Fusibacter ferrireducens]